MSLRRSFAALAALCTLALAPAAAPAADPPETIALPGTARDFRPWTQGGHVDFENANGNEMGIVRASLGSDGLPVYAKDGVSSATTHGRAAFDQWFRDVPGVNLTEPVSLPLRRDARTGLYEYAAPSFFPLDGRGWVAAGRELTMNDALGVPRNFSFTVHLRGELLYTGAERLVRVVGDDDIFLFVNHRRALDLGGVHGPIDASVDLAQNAVALGLTPGRLVDVDLFVAERHTSGSSLRLTLPRLGFDAGAVALDQGAATAGDPLTCETSGWPEDVTLAYAWLRDGAPIAGESAATYATTDADAGAAVACRVTGARRTEASAASAPVTVAARPAQREPEPQRRDPEPERRQPDPERRDPVVDPPLPPAPPSVEVTGEPGLTRSRAVRVVFATDPSAAGYECRLDDGPWAPCGSPHVIQGLRAGDHAVEIRAVMADGRRGPSARRTFQVNPYPPRISVPRGALRAAAGGIVRVRVACSPREGEGRGSCRGTVALRRVATGRRARARPVTLGRATFSAGAGRAATARIRLSAAGRRLLAAMPPRRGLRVRVVVDARDLAGNRGTLSVARTLRR